MTFDVRLDEDIATVCPSIIPPEPEANRFMEALLGAAPRESAVRMLFDLRRTDGAPEKERLRTAAQFLASLRPRLAAQHAVVVRDKLQLGLARELAGWADLYGLEIRVFRSLDGAQAWLADPRPGRAGEEGP
jgi:hypothetical protein